MRNLFNIIFFINLISCQVENDLCCIKSNVIISDVYSVEYENKSRFICIKGIPGISKSSKYLVVSQIHEYEYMEHIITVDFQHNIVDDNMIIDTNAIRTEKSKFGLLQINAFSKNGKYESTYEVKKAVENIKVNYFEGVDVCYGVEDSINIISNELTSIGATKFTKSNNRKTLTIKLPNNDSKTMIAILFENIDLIYKHLKDKDLIKFEASGTSYDILRSYVLTDSKGFKKYPDEWCGMGPIEKRFECIYVKNNDL